jgi:hypothetical protein
MNKIFYLYVGEFKHLPENEKPHKFGMSYFYYNSVKNSYCYKVTDDALFSIFLLKYSDVLPNSKIVYE